MISVSQRLRFIVPILALALTGAGCFDTGTTAPTGPDGGVWKTSDGGVTWVNKKSLITTGPKVSASGATFNILGMTVDPQDRRAIYLATADSGLVYSLDGGDSWQQAKIPGTRVNSVAVDAKNKCIVYATTGNHIYKTETCGRDWKEVFFGARTEVSFTQIVADWYNTTMLYAGTSDGDIFRSQDSGVTWTKMIRADGTPITSLVVDPRDSRIVYAGTQGAGILKTEDSGATWTQVFKQFGDDYRDARRVIQVIPDPAQAKRIYIVSKYGILRSDDAGDTWTALKLTTPPGTIKINSLAIDPKNNKNILFTGVSTLQFTTDGGASWSPKRLPTTQAGSFLQFDPMDSKIIYLGTTPPPQKN